jgi:beta-mannosidase
MESHQKHPRGTELIQKYMEREFVIPEDFEDYVYVSQVLQAEGMAEAFLSHRTSQPYCMGTLYWQLNDCWPVTSWAGLDYYGNWKALHYHVKRAFAPIMVSTKQNKSRIEIYAVNDHKEEVSLDLITQVMTLSGNLISESKKSVVLAPLTNQLVGKVAAPLENRENLVIITSLKHENSIASRSFCYFVPTKKMNLKDPGLTIETEDSDTGTIIIVKAEKHARQVFLDGVGLEGYFEDNYFDMQAGETRRIRFIGETDAVQLAEILKVKSIYETFN